MIFHYIATPNIGGDIPIDVPTNQNIGGDTSPASPAGLTPMQPASHVAVAITLNAKASSLKNDRSNIVLTEFT